MTRRNADTITDDELDALYGRLELANRALGRAHSLAESWEGDPAPITGSEVSDALYAAIRLHGWTRGDTPPLRLVAAEESARA